MGKSKKKVKNDRINAIRKQYDAFLEEDKKRRERNEYILCKLDKMRSANALLPISAKVNQPEYKPPEIYLRSDKTETKSLIRSSYLPQLEPQNFTSDKLNNLMDESLKEISKKYILIPKQRTPLENEYIYHKNVIDRDWKSKYDILNDLKKQVLEGDDHANIENNNKLLDSNKDVESNIYEEQTYILENNNHSYLDKPITNQNNDLNITKMCNKSLQEQILDQDNNKIDFEISRSNSKINGENAVLFQTNCIPQKDLAVIETKSNGSPVQEISPPYKESATEKEDHNSVGNEKTINHLAQYISLTDTSQIAERGIEKQIEYQENVEITAYDHSAAETNKYVACDNATTGINSTMYAEPQELEAVQFSEEASKVNDSIVNNKNESDSDDLTSIQQVGPYGDIDPEDQIESNQETQNYDPAQNMIPAGLENIQHPEHVEYESEINAFETEQKEMFDSEQTSANTYAYNQGERNTEEFPAEGYEQNDQYAYYEGVQQEQAYATDVNEHEESTERYDPHYNEQYGASYGNQQPDNTVDYEDTKTYEQQPFQGESYENTQHENTVNYGNEQQNANIYQQEDGNNELQVNGLPSQDNQIYDQLYSEQPNTQDHIEQQLIVEEGYKENSVQEKTKGILQENEGEIEQVLNRTTPTEQMPDPNVS